MLRELSMFFHLAELAIFAAMLVPVILSVCVLVYVRRKNKKQWVQFLAFLFSLLAGGVFLLFLGVALWGYIQQSRPGKPMYSPDQKMAALISYGFEAGERTEVDLYSSHGLHRDEVFIFPEIKAVKNADVHWIDNKHLVIQYQNHSRYHDARVFCHNAGDIQVECIAKPAP